MRRDSETKDAPPEGWLQWARRVAPREAQPRLRLLVHSDLQRIGWTSVPGVVPAGESWLTVGRHDPPFAGEGAAQARPLDDPYVSREQLRVRWIPGDGQFEVAPAPAGRRPISRVDLATSGSGEATPITGPTRLLPGDGVAIGDRVLLGLTLSGVHAPFEDRLGLVGEHEALWALRDEIRSVAQFGGSALVTGPTGAGKELVARALHAQSPRADGPFLAVNCASLPDNLVESVLFGHKRGAFTGATADEKGLFRAADGGTLFFDELGELPLLLQPKLLRVLQDGVVVPVGAHDGHRVDVRVVAATHRDLEAYVQAGKLREDLYHRLSAHALLVPSLAERRFDVPQLFVHALGLLRAEHPALGWLWAAAEEWRPALPFGFLADLIRRPWRGNVRELQNLAQRTARKNLHPGAFQAPDLPATQDDDHSSPGASSRSPKGVDAPPIERAPSSPEVAVGPPPSTRDVPSDATPPTSAADDAIVRSAGDTLGIARKTLLKLLARSAMVDLAAEADRLGLAAEERARRLRASAAEALLAMLEARDFNQSSVATALGASRTTLIKLMDDLGLPRAADLGAEEIQRARAQAGGDLDAAAKILRVSPSALKKRVTMLGSKG
jgi:two-component system nitrogen regulation response regulator GlnG